MPEPLADRTNRQYVWHYAFLSALVLAIAAIFGPRHAFVTLCHQMVDRSFVVNGHLFSVCHRCTGIYLALPAGMLAGAGLDRFTGKAIRLIAILVTVAVGLVALNVGLDWMGLVENTPLTRAATGALVGGTAGALLSLVLQNHDALTSTRTSTRALIPTPASIKRDASMLH